uniref:Reverse transcriptase domain-containing protein n=1 Tax=Anolis carolinensis TaxID=28377 RepID=A0A803TU91_ANOCA
IKNNFQRQNTNTTKKLANYLKNMKEKGRVIQLKNKYNKKVNSTKEIREAFVDFYQELYKKQIHGEFDEKIQKIIDREDNRKLGTEISYQEIEQVIDTLKNRKSLGGDGYTAEFYKEMKEIIIPELKILFNNIMKGGKIPDTWRESEIITVRKSGKDPEDPNSYRPIKAIHEIQIILKDFERYSGLKVNMSKSEMMIYNMGKKEQKELQTKMGDIKIIRNKIKYLGITITKEITKLKAANYGAIWKKIQEKLKAWGDKQLSIPRKILALKMCIIPKLLYLFQTLSIKIDYRQIKEWDNTLREWIYGKKRNRIMKKIQYTPRRLLGWGFPNLQNYYEAFQLRSLLEISLKGEDKWIKVENEINEGRGKYGLYTRDIKEIKEKLTGPRKIEFECWQKWQKLWANKISGKTPIKSMGLPERLVNTLEEKGLRRVKDICFLDKVFLAYITACLPSLPHKIMKLKWEGGEPCTLCLLP